MRNKGFGVLASNWRSPRDERHELDLVCSDGEILVFVEVKTRQAGSVQRGFEAVNRRKRQALHRAAQAYLHCLPGHRRPRAVRFDIVEVVYRGQGSDPEILHFENAPLFRPRFVP